MAFFKKDNGKDIDISNIKPTDKLKLMQLLIGDGEFKYLEYARRVDIWNRWKKLFKRSIDLSHTNLSKQTLTGFDLSFCSFRKANLEGADLRGAKFEKVKN